eukprot:Gb_37709 [translate_table: standard]
MLCAGKHVLQAVILCIIMLISYWFVMICLCDGRSEEKPAASLAGAAFSLFTADVSKSIVFLDYWTLRAIYSIQLARTFKRAALSFIGISAGKWELTMLRMSYRMFVWEEEPIIVQDWFGKWWNREAIFSFLDAVTGLGTA